MPSVVSVRDVGDYRHASISALAAALRARRVSPGEIAGAALSLLNDVGRSYNAVATLLPERASRQAAAAERALSRGDAPLLCGIPYGAKDVFAARGAPTTWGSPAFSTQVLDTDAVVLRRLSARGAVLVAKLAMDELAGVGRAALHGASLQGQGRNPWDPSRYSGGSSSGPGIVVSTGLLPFSLGTETGGSILGPAAYCGITGFRPTYGLVPRSGAMTVSWSLDKVGPLARSADDCVIVMATITGRDASHATRRPHFSPFQSADLAAMASVRVAHSDRELEEASPSIRAALSEGVKQVRRLLPLFVAKELRRDLPYGQAIETVMRAEAAFQLRGYLEREDFRTIDEHQLAGLRSGLRMTAVDYLAALGVAAATRNAFKAVFSDVDVILSASRPAVAPRLDEPRAPVASDRMSDILRAAGNLAGLPAVSFPCGLSDEGLPVGLQLVGPRGSDRLLLGLVSAYQRETDHHLHKPPAVSGPPATLRA